MSTGRRQATVWNNAGLLLIGPLGINVSEIVIEINTSSITKIHLNVPITQGDATIFPSHRASSAGRWFLYEAVLNKLLNKKPAPVIRNTLALVWRHCNSPPLSVAYGMTHLISTHADKLRRCQVIDIIQTMFLLYISGSSGLELEVRQPGCLCFADMEKQMVSNCPIFTRARIGKSLPSIWMVWRNITFFMEILYAFFGNPFIDLNINDIQLLC